MSEETTINLDELNQMHPADVADELQRLSLEDAQSGLLALPRKLAADALSEMEWEKAEQLLESLPEEKLTGFFLELPHSDVADLLGLLPPGNQRRLLNRLPAEHSTDIRQLLGYSDDSAGGIMTDRFIALRSDQTVQQSMDMLRSRDEQDREDVAYLYVTDAAEKLVGILPIRDLVFARADRKISDLMDPNVGSIGVDDDQEEIARRLEHYHYLGLPVVDKHGYLVGVVRATEALEVARAEATEDMQLMVGLSGEERALTPWNRSILRRLPWLYVNLFTAFMAAAVIW